MWSIMLFKESFISVGILATTQTQLYPTHFLSLKKLLVKCGSSTTVAEEMHKYIMTFASIPYFEFEEKYLDSVGQRFLRLPNEPLCI